MASGSETPNVREDVVAAVRRLLPPTDAGDALGWLNRLDSDRVQVDVLVIAVLQGQPYLPTIRKEVANAIRDFRDVLQAEYFDRNNYKPVLAQLGLERGYPD